MAHGGKSLSGIGGSMKVRDGGLGGADGEENSVWVLVTS